MPVFVPKLFTTLQNYTRAQALADVTAGVIVGIVALPLAIAFAIASGVTPDRGLWTAIIAGFLISALGGSRVQIGGPTGAFVVIVYGVVQRFGVDGLIVATMMAGVMLVLLGIARLGTAIKFIPHPVITGFTSGIAVIIFSSQVKDFLGLRMGTVPADFLDKWREYADAMPTFTPAATAVAALALAIIVIWPRVTHKVPGPFVALIATTVLVQYLDLPVETIGSRFGALSASLPVPHLPSVTIAQAQALIAPAFTIALLGAIESLLSAVVADGMIGGRHRSNTELVAQGIANIVTPMFGGIPATGAIARTATNVKNGGRTPVAGMVHAITLLIITLFAGRWAAYIPMPALAAILVVVAYHMSEWRTFRSELRSPKSDVLVLLATFVLTVLVDLTVAIETGMVLAAFLFMRRMAEVTSVGEITREARDGSHEQEEALGISGRVGHTGVRIPDGVQVYEVNGPFFFGAAERFKDTVARVSKKPKVLIIRLRHVPAIDATAMAALRDVVRRSRKDGTLVMLSDIQGQPLEALSRSTVVEDIGMENIFPDLDAALARAAVHVGDPTGNAHVSRWG
jgi:sulfate permease, SulP family